MRHAYRCHAALDAPASASDRPRERTRIDAGDLLDIARCPCCRFPLVARMGREGPYFHCRCSESKRNTSEEAASTRISDARSAG
jgi:hypothetical protein